MGAWLWSGRAVGGVGAARSAPGRARPMPSRCPAPQTTWVERISDALNSTLGHGRCGRRSSLPSPSRSKIVCDTGNRSGDRNCRRPVTIGARAALLHPPPPVLCTSVQDSGVFERILRSARLTTVCIPHHLARRRLHVYCLPSIPTLAMGPGAGPRRGGGRRGAGGADSIDCAKPAARHGAPPVRPPRGRLPDESRGAVHLRSLVGDADQRAHPSVLRHRPGGRPPLDPNAVASLVSRAAPDAATARPITGGGLYDSIVAAGGR